MANKTGQDLVNDARSRAGYQNTNFVLDPEILSWVNDAAEDLQDIIVAQDESILSQPFPFTLPDPVLAAACAALTLPAPPPNFAALPSNCDRLQGVDFADAQGPYDTSGGPAGMRSATVRMFNFQNRNDWNAMTGGMRYKMFGQIAGQEVIMVQPEDNAGGNYRLWFIPQWTPLALTDSLTNIFQRFNRYISIGAAIQILVKAKRDTNQLVAEREKVAQRVTEMSNNRDSEAEQGGSDRQGHYTDGWPYRTRGWPL